jgi:hypothetical protein
VPLLPPVGVPADPAAPPIVERPPVPGAAGSASLHAVVGDATNASKKAKLNRRTCLIFGASIAARINARSRRL